MVHGIYSQKAGVIHTLYATLKHFHFHIKKYVVFLFILLMSSFFTFSFQIVKRIKSNYLNARRLNVHGSIHVPI